MRRGGEDMWYGMGIDPGKTGGIAIVSADGRVAIAHRYPIDDGDHGVRALFGQLLERRTVALCVLERVASMPRDAAKSAFSFGQNFGSWRMALVWAEVPFVEITPQKWRNATFDARANATKGADKKTGSLDLARRLYPAVDLRYKADDGKAEALLMARYAVTLHART